MMLRNKRTNNNLITKMQMNGAYVCVSVCAPVFLVFTFLLAHALLPLLAITTPRGSEVCVPRVSNMS